MSLQFTTACPVHDDLEDACGLPLAVIAQPLAQQDALSPAAATAASCWAADLARCSRCLGYINSLCELDEESWVCALCGSHNTFSSASCLRRYYNASAERLAALPELASPAVDALCPLVAGEEVAAGEEVLQLEAQPAYLALVDVACSEESLELVRSSLAAAVEALPPAARFGIVSFGSQVGLHLPAAGGSGMVVHAALGESNPPELEEVARLGQVLAHVGSRRQGILSTIDQLEAEPTAGGGRTRALGETLRAVLRWVATGSQQAAAAAQGGLGGRQDPAYLQYQQYQQPGQQQWEDEQPLQQPQQQGQQQQEEQWQQEGEGLARAPGFPGMRLLLFLSGPPNSGPGAVVRLRKPSEDTSAAAAVAQKAAEEAARELASLTLDPVYPELSAWSENVARTANQWQEAARAQAAAAAAATAAAGDLSHAAPPGISGEQLEVEPAAEEFYTEAGAAAAALSICVDVFAASPNWLGLNLLHPLVRTSGGTMLLYGSAENALMPQDVYKSVTTPRAFGCLLRLRCCPELEVTGHHGRLLADRQQSDLFHGVTCGPDDAFVFTLERTAMQAACEAPAVQLVLQYSMLVPAPVLPPAEAGTGQGEAAATSGSRYVLQRRMRIITAALPLACDYYDMFSSADCEALGCLAVHKALEMAEEQGEEAARGMLRDWLVLVAAKMADPKVDASLSAYENLQHLPHLMYALLHGPLLHGAGATPPAAGAAAAPATAPLQPQGPWQHPDGLAAMRSLLQVLPADEVAVAVCPQLSSWGSPDEVAGVQHSLSAAALSVNPQPLWVLDAYWQITVLLTGGSGKGSTESGAIGAVVPAVEPPPPQRTPSASWLPAALRPAQQPAPAGNPAAATPPTSQAAAAEASTAVAFPPPATSLLQTTLAGIRKVRRCTPALLFLRQGADDTSAFDSWLIEDTPPTAATASAAAAAGSVAVHVAPSAPPPSFVVFLDSVAQQARQLLQQLNAGR